MNTKQYVQHIKKEFDAKESKGGIIPNDGVRFRITTIHKKEEVAVERVEDGDTVTVLETRSTPQDHLAVYAKGEPVFLLAPGSLVDTEARDAEIEKAMSPLPGEVVDPDASESFSAIGLVPMKSNHERLQLVRVDIFHGRVVNREPLFKHEAERKAFAFSRLIEDYLPTIATMMNDDKWETKKEEPKNG